MCSRPSTSLPDLMRWSVVASVFSSSAIFLSFGRTCVRGEGVGVEAILPQALEVAAAGGAAVLAEQELRSKEGYQAGRRRAAERALYRLRVGHARSHTW